MLLVATGRIPNGDLLDAELAGVEVDETARSWSTSTNAPLRAAFSRSATCRSDYQLKHVANHEMRVVKHNLLQDWDDTEH